MCPGLVSLPGEYLFYAYFPIASISRWGWLEAMKVSDAVRARLLKSDESTYKIAKDSRVAWKTLKRFVDGANIRSDQLDLLCEYLDLIVVDAKRAKGK